MHGINMTQHQYLYDLVQELSREESPDADILCNRIALMAFLIAYCLFEAPSNILLKRTSPSKWIALLMLSFGVITIGIGGAKNFATLTALRFLLGMFEAGESWKEHCVLSIDHIGRTLSRPRVLYNVLV